MENNDSKLEKLFRLARHTPVKTPDYLATRVMAAYQSRHSAKGFFWYALRFGLPAILVLLTASLFLPKGHSFTAAIMAPYVVKVEMAPMSPSAQIEAEVVLPDGVDFYSASIPEVSQQRMLRFTVHNDNQQGVVPFVIRSSEKGRREVHVKFYNENNQMVMEKVVHIDFVEGGS